MNRQLLELALERLRPSDWESFEVLSSQFLASDFSELRTMAAPSGDGGRDSELFSPTGAANVVFQYSVAENWSTKINKTITRIKSLNSSASILIYMTNQIIGAKADVLRKAVLSNGLYLDIRDRNWFLERFEHDDAKFKAATMLVDRYAKPYLEGSEIIANKRPSLSNQEAKAALVYLAMQWEDENQEKGLTKLAFESLVRAALRRTNSDSRMKRNEIHDKIISYLPSAHPEKINSYIDSALQRLNKKCIRHWMQTDEFCLTFDEIERLKLKLAAQECEEREFDRTIKCYVDLACGDGDQFTVEVKDDVAQRARRVVDDFLLKSGESFAQSVLSGYINKIDNEDLKNSIFSDINKYPPVKTISKELPSVLIDAVTQLLFSSKEEVRKHLRNLSDSYTLFSFLREAPDVQAATKKIFSHGSIWLDTTVILPLIVDSLKQDEIDKRFTEIIHALNESGVELFVTDGVIDEILNHLRISEKCSVSRINEWKGRVPYLYYHYVELGYDPSNFKSWAELIRGRERPEDDISEYLKQVFNIRVVPLRDEANGLDVDVKACVERLWGEAHETRRTSTSGNEQDSHITNILVKNDVDSYAGIVVLRSKEGTSELGYKHWWLTIDTIAWKIRDAIKAELKDRTPASPLMSLDFLARNLAFGPARSRIVRTREQLLPLVLDLDLSEAVPREIIEIAERVRQESIDLPDYVVKRKVRDACDKAKRTMGRVTKEAINAGQKGGALQ